MSGDDEKSDCLDDMFNSDEEKEPFLSSYQSSLASSRSPSQEPQSESESESERKDVKITQSLPPASRFKRTFLLLLFATLCWLAYSNVLHTKRKPKVVHASRYSKEYQFRPAASPVITETLKDGRTRLRGALPEPALPTTTPSAGKKKKRKPKVGNVSGKRKSSGTKRRPVNKKKI